MKIECKIALGWKDSSLLGAFVKSKENEVLWILCHDRLPNLVAWRQGPGPVFTKLHFLHNLQIGTISKRG